jgi:hypothetical protein
LTMPRAREKTGAAGAATELSGGFRCCIWQHRWQHRGAASSAKPGQRVVSTAFFGSTGFAAGCAFVGPPVRPYARDDQPGKRGLFEMANGKAVLGCSTRSTVSEDMT